MLQTRNGVSNLSCKEEKRQTLDLTSDHVAALKEDKS